MNQARIEIGSETVAEIERRVDQSDRDVSDVVRDAVEVYLKLDNPEELINESSSD